MSGAPATRLDQFDRTEWWDVCRRVKPDLTEAEFARLWEEFHARVAERLRLRNLQ